MSSAKEIKNKINSIIHTQKITQTMELVAISKLKKVKLKMLSGRLYLESISKVIQHLSQSNLENRHFFLNHRQQVKKIGIIVISTDRGLCGNLNNNLFKKILLNIEKFSENNNRFELILFGAKSVNFFSNFKINIISKMVRIKEIPDFFEIAFHVQKILESYNSQIIDEIFLAYNHFKNSMIYIPKFIRLLPISFQELGRSKLERWDYIYEPNSKYLLKFLLNRFIKSKVFQSVLENISSEHSARMTAMKTATDNSKKSIEELQLLHNKLRQSSITQELTEIISGYSVIS